MENRPNPFRSNPVVAFLLLLISLVISGFGILHMATGYAPGRFTRLGYAQPLYDASAQQFGLSIVLLGLLPLCLLARTGKQAAWAAALLVAAFGLNLIAGASLWE